LNGILRALVKNGNHGPHLSSPNRPFLRGDARRTGKQHAAAAILFF
jgi:hypothetical protein